MGQTVAIIQTGRPDINPNMRACNVRRHNRRIFKRFPNDLQQYPLLRIHLRCFTRRNTKNFGLTYHDIIQNTRGE